MTTYKLSNFGNGVVKDSKSFIPFDPANTDYQAFLAWCAEGNTPEPEDEVANG